MSFGLSDTPELRDALGFKPYVEVVSDFLLDQQTQAPLTVSVEGEWGSGKSSFMRQLEASLKQKNKDCRTVWFSAWRYDKADSLWASFAVSTIDQLAHQTGWLNRVVSNVALKLERFHSGSGLFGQLLSIATWTLLIALCITGALELFHQPHSGHEGLFNVLAAGGILGALLSLIRLAKDAMQLLGNPLKNIAMQASKGPEYNQYSAFIEEFHEDFARILQSYVGYRRMFVFIDDLDRCEVPRAADLMQALNLMISDSLNIIYILGIDRDKIAAGLTAKFENLLPYLLGDGYEGSKIEFGYAYLEKFLQLPFRLPQPTPSAIKRMLNPDMFSEHTIVADEYIEQFRIEPEVVLDAAEIVGAALDYNPRRIKQFVNCYRLYAALTKSLALFRQEEQFQEGEDLTFQKLAKLIAINLRWPRFLLQALAEPSLLESVMESNNPKNKEYWGKRPALLDLLRFGLPGSDGMEWLLLPKDIDIFFRVAPSLVPPSQSSVTPEASRSASKMA